MAKAESKSTRVPPKEPADRLKEVRKILYDLDPAFMHVKNRIRLADLAAIGLRESTETELCDAMCDGIGSIEEVVDHIKTEVCKALHLAKSA
jgi:hypothetical protein